jgi:uncharacterized caspase-like protein
MRFFIGLIFAAGILVLTSSGVFAEKRVALVIGNSAYENVARLPNPMNDATAIAKMFSDAGFEVVHSRSNLGNLEFKRSLREFTAAARDADIAVVFYAGHGIEVRGTNYLIPVDAKLATEYDAEDEAVPLNRVMDAMETATRLRLIILDACRDNPFKSRMQRTVASRALSNGLAKIEPQGMDTLIAYAAKAGSTADDGQGANSPFTTALLKHLTVPGRDIRIAFGHVRDEVLKNTGNKQEPFVYGSLGGAALPLVAAPAVPVAPAAVTAALAPDPNAAVRSDYEFAERVGTKEAWDYFLSIYSKGYYANLAQAQRNKIIAAEAQQTADKERAEKSAKASANAAEAEAKRERELKAERAAKAAAEAAVADAKKEKELAAKAAAEAAATEAKRERELKAARAAAETAAADAKKEKELAAKAAAEAAAADAKKEKELAAKAAAAIAAAEAKKEEELKAARAAAEAAVAEAKKQRELAAKAVADAAAAETKREKELQAAKAAAEAAAVEAKKEKELAAKAAADAAASEAKREKELQAVKAAAESAEAEAKKQKLAALTPPASTESRALDDTARLLQNELKRVGCYEGEVDSSWSMRARWSLDRFNKNAGLKLDTSAASFEALDAVKTRPSRVCPLECGTREVERNGICVAKTCPRGETLEANGRCTAPRKATAQRAPKERAERAPRAAGIESQPSAPAVRGADYQDPMRIK